VIDVNSGYKSVSNNQEENALQTNMEAAEEIARQLRLRDIGGIIVVDFIDMKLPENKKKLNEAMENFMKIDRAKHAVLAISKIRTHAVDPSTDETRNEHQYAGAMPFMSGNR